MKILLLALGLLVTINSYADHIKCYGPVTTSDFKQSSGIVFEKDSKFSTWYANAAGYYTIKTTDGTNYYIPINNCYITVNN